MCIVRRERRPGKGVSKGVRPGLRRRVWEAAKKRCTGCGIVLDLSQVLCHHIREVADGGTDDVRNLMCLCVNCHKFTQDWAGYKHYWRRLKCGCRIRVAYGPRAIPSQRVRKALKIQWPPPFQIDLIRDLCSKHAALEHGDKTILVRMPR